jgi:photosystem II stability/assembly factor-like uncharacterized protein
LYSLTAALLAALLVVTPTLPTSAMDDPPAAWQPTPLAAETLELFTPASGALFARTPAGLQRSDDAGDTWAPVPLPPPPARRGNRWVTVDPTNHTVLYAAGADGLYRTTDDAASWQLIRPLPTPSAWVNTIVVSPANPAVLYVYFETANSLTFQRSRDGGATWDPLTTPPGGSPCTWQVVFLQPHPTDAARLFRTAGCFAGRDIFGGYTLRQSADYGDTWADWAPSPNRLPHRLVGGQAPRPARFYLAFLGAMGGPSRLARTDDDGRTWLPVLDPSPAADRNPQVRGLAYDPAAPDRVFAALTEEQGVLASADAGATWADLSPAPAGQVNDLALGIDARYLFAATDQGVWRADLTRPHP